MPDILLPKGMLVFSLRRFMFSRPEMAVVILLFPSYAFAIKIIRVSEGLDLEIIYFNTSILYQIA